MSQSDVIKRAQSSFLRQFGMDAGKRVTLVASPSRLTLLGGEYTEATDGYSLLAGGNHSVVVAAQRRTDREAAFYSANYDEKLKFPMSTLKFEKGDGWSNYLKGVAYFYERTGRRLDGLSMTVASDIPESAGLGTSAAITTAASVACNIVGNNPLDDATLAKLCQRVEHQFMGLRGDYFSPYACRLAKKDHLVVFDARTFKPEYVPFPSSQAKLVCVDSCVKKKERDEEMKKRFDLFQQMLPEIRKVVPKVLSLRDVTAQSYEPARKSLDIIVRKRLDHVVYENERVLKARDTLKRGDLENFGRILSDSHDSLTNKLKVTCPEVDILYAAAMKAPGCLGARMAGPGFGGHLVCLVRAKDVEAFGEQVKRDYKKQVNIFPQVWVNEPQEGAHEVEGIAIPSELSDSND